PQPEKEYGDDADERRGPDGLRRHRERWPDLGDEGTPERLRRGDERDHVDVEARLGRAVCQIGTVTGLGAEQPGGKPAESEEIDSRRWQRVDKSRRTYAGHAGRTDRRDEEDHAENRHDHLPERDDGGNDVAAADVRPRQEPHGKPLDETRPTEKQHAGDRQEKDDDWQV